MLSSLWITCSRLVRSNLLDWRYCGCADARGMDQALYCRGSRSLEMQRWRVEIRRSAGDAQQVSAAEASYNKAWRATACVFVGGCFTMSPRDMLEHSKASLLCGAGWQTETSSCLWLLQPRTAGAARVVLKGGCLPGPPALLNDLGGQR